MTVRVVVLMRCEPEARESVVQQFAALSEQVRTEDGCEEYALHTSGRDGLVITEAWRDKDALRAHGEAPSMAAFTEVASQHLTSGPDVHVLRPAATTAS